MLLCYNLFKTLVNSPNIKVETMQKREENYRQNKKKSLSFKVNINEMIQNNTVGKKQENILMKETGQSHRWSQWKNLDTNHTFSKNFRHVGCYYIAKKNFMRLPNQNWYFLLKNCEKKKDTSIMLCSWKIVVIRDTANERAFPQVSHTLQSAKILLIKLLLTI